MPGTGRPEAHSQPLLPLFSVSSPGRWQHEAYASAPRFLANSLRSCSWPCWLPGSDGKNRASDRALLLFAGVGRARAAFCTRPSAPGLVLSPKVAGGESLQRGLFGCWRTNTRSPPKLRAVSTGGRAGEQLSAYTRALGLGSFPLLAGGFLFSSEDRAAFGARAAVLAPLLAVIGGRRSFGRTPLRPWRLSPSLPESSPPPAADGRGGLRLMPGQFREALLRARRDRAAESLHPAARFPTSSDSVAEKDSFIKF